MDYHKVPVFSIRLEDEVKAKLVDLAMHHDVSMAEIVRRCVVSEHENI